MTIFWDDCFCGVRGPKVSTGEQVERWLIEHYAAMHPALLDDLRKRVYNAVAAAGVPVSCAEVAAALVKAGRPLAMKTIRNHLAALNLARRLTVTGKGPTTRYAAALESGKKPLGRVDTTAENI